MPKFIRYFIKTSLLFFVISLLLGIVMASGTVIALPNFLSSILPTYLHMFTVGWITQMIFGVSIWMFPSSDKEGRYGKETIIWSIYVTLNSGLILRLIGEPGQSVLPASVMFDLCLVFSAILQWLASLLYVYHIWGRVKGK